MLETVSEKLKETRAFENDMRKFGDIVTSNKEVQKALSEAVDSGISRDAFRDLYVKTAAQHNIHFTIQQMDIAMHEQKQGSDKVLPMFVQKLVTIL